MIATSHAMEYTRHVFAAENKVMQQKEHTTFSIHVHAFTLAVYAVILRFHDGNSIPNQRRQSENDVRSYRDASAFHVAELLFPATVEDQGNAKGHKVSGHRAKDVRPSSNLLPYFPSLFG